MKRRIMTASLIILAFVLLCPIPMRLKDGGTVKYQALLYSVSDVHRLAPSSESSYEEGLVIEIFGIEVYNDVKPSGTNTETQWALAAHFYLDGKGYFHHGALTYELPDGYEYVADVIHVGNTSSKQDFEGNVDGKIYMNESVSHTAYFSWAQWDEEADGPAPFLKLELEDNR